MTPLVVLTLSFGIGVAVQQLRPMGMVPVLVGFFVFGAATLALRKGKWPFLVTGYAVLGLFTGGARRVSLTFRARQVRSLGPFGRCAVRGTATGVKGGADGRWAVRLGRVVIRCPGKGSIRWPLPVEISGKGPRPEVLPGERIYCRGRLRPDLAWALGRRTGVGRSAVISVGQVRSLVRLWVKRGVGVGLDRLLSVLRARAERLLGGLDPPMGRRILWAMVLGPSRQAGPSLLEGFGRLGLIHLLVISGLHLALVAGLFFGLSFWVFKRIPKFVARWPARRLSAFATLPIVWGYVGLAGPSAATLRAAVMVTCGLMGLVLDRHARAANGLSVSGLILISWHAEWISSPGFQLSFSAVSSLIWVSRRIRARFSKSFEPPSFPRKVVQYLGGVFIGSIGATVGTAPLVAFHFGRVALLSVVTNLVAVPFYCLLVLPWAFAGLGLGLVFPEAGSAILGPLSGLVAESGAVVIWLSRWAPTVEGIVGLDVFETFCIYLALSVVVGWRVEGSAKRFLQIRVLVFALSMVGLLTSGAVRVPTEAGVSVTFLKVGSGDAVVVELPGKKVILVDGGGKGPEGWDAGRRVILPFLKRRGYRRLDVVVLTHPHSDHYGGLSSVFAKLEVGQLWMTRQWGQSGVQLSLMKWARKKGVTVRFGGRFSSGSTTVEVVHPTYGARTPGSPYPTFSVNDNSMVLLVSHPSGRILLTGDIEQDAEAVLSRHPERVRAEVLKVPHHGSRGALSIPFLRAVKPCLAVITGAGSARGVEKVVGIYREAGIRALATWMDGPVTVTIGAEGIRFGTRAGGRHRLATCGTGI